jgi:hypothetical protein
MRCGRHVLIAALPGYTSAKKRAHDSKCTKPEETIIPVSFASSTEIKAKEQFLKRNINQPHKNKDIPIKIVLHRTHCAIGPEDGLRYL